MADFDFGDEWGIAVDVRCPKCKRFLSGRDLTLVLLKCYVIVLSWTGLPHVIVGSCKRCGRVRADYGGFV